MKLKNCIQWVITYLFLRIDISYCRPPWSNSSFTLTNAGSSTCYTLNGSHYLSLSTDIYVIQKVDMKLKNCIQWVITYLFLRIDISYCRPPWSNSSFTLTNAGSSTCYTLNGSHYLSLSTDILYVIQKVDMKLKNCIQRQTFFASIFKLCNTVGNKLIIVCCPSCSSILTYCCLVTCLAHNL